MLRKIIILCFFLFLILKGAAQEIPRDTSYTIHSAYKKLVKHYPEIKIVHANLPEDVMAKEEVIYRQVKRHGLTMNIYYPNTNDNVKFPAVLLIHGGGWRTGDKKLLIPMAQQLASAGYVTVVAEYQLSLEAPYPAAVHDLKAAIRWLRAHADNFPIDTDKIAVYGTSAGGQLATLIGTTNNKASFEGEGDNLEYSSEVQAIINVDGVLAFKHPESKEGTMASEWLGGTYEEIPSTWKEASALTHVGKETPPTLFIASSHPRFHAGKEDMIKILKENAIYYESHYIKDSPHSFWLMEPWFKPTLNYTVDFLNDVFKSKK